MRRINLFENIKIIYQKLVIKPLFRNERIFIFLAETQIFSRAQLNAFLGIWKVMRTWIMYGDVNKCLQIDVSNTGDKVTIAQKNHEIDYENVTVSGEAPPGNIAFGQKGVILVYTFLYAYYL